MLRRYPRSFLTRQIWPLGAPLVLIGLVLVARTFGAETLVGWLIGLAAMCLIVTLVVILVASVSSRKSRARR
jgi:uncharacterized membrane protein YkvI